MNNSYGWLTDTKVCSTDRELTVWRREVWHTVTKKFGMEQWSNGRRKCTGWKANSCKPFEHSLLDAAALAAGDGVARAGFGGDALVQVGDDLDAVLRDPAAARVALHLPAVQGRGREGQKQEEASGVRERVELPV